MTLGICQQSKWQRKAHGGEIIPWDSIPYADKREAAHAKARVLCASCPVLEACERYLSDMERAGVCVAGVVAGRYCDLLPNSVSGAGPQRLPPADAPERQTTCRGCGQRMWPQRASPQRVAETPAPQHQGEGLCNDCYPHLSRTNRTNRTSK